VLPFEKYSKKKFPESRFQIFVAAFVSFVVFPTSNVGGTHGAALMCSKQNISFSY
jgi:hypothetical protein